MSRIRGASPLIHRRLGRAEFDLLHTLELDPEQAERFLGPLSGILDAVRRSVTHALFSIESDGGLIGFYVLHPDRRDASCWWLGWFAIDRRLQGCGLGRIAMRAIAAQFARTPRCRRARLLVGRDNGRARSLYAAFGFRTVGASAETGELILEASVVGVRDTVSDVVFALVTVIRSRRARRAARLRLAPGPHETRCLGVERGPPAMAGDPHGGPIDRRSPLPRRSPWLPPCSQSGLGGDDSQQGDPGAFPHNIRRGCHPSAASRARHGGDPHGPRRGRGGHHRPARLRVRQVNRWPVGGPLPGRSCAPEPVGTAALPIRSVTNQRK